MNIGLTSFETSFDFDFSMADRTKQKKKYGSQLFQGKYGSYRNTFHVVMPFKAQLKQKQGRSGITTLSKLTLELCKGQRTVKQEPEVGHLMPIQLHKRNVDGCKSQSKQARNQSQEGP